MQSGEVLKFRLNDIDAPETGGVGAAIGGAKCEKERELGFITDDHGDETDTDAISLTYQRISKMWGNLGSLPASMDRGGMTGRRRWSRGRIGA